MRWLMSGQANLFGTGMVSFVCGFMTMAILQAKLAFSTSLSFILGEVTAGLWFSYAMHGKEDSWYPRGFRSDAASRFLLGVAAFALGVAWLVGTQMLKLHAAAALFCIPVAGMVGMVPLKLTR